MTDLVKDKVIIVTGGARGIGRAISLMLAEEGAKIVISDIGASLGGEGQDQGPGQEVLDAIKAKGGQAILNTLSITEPKNAELIVEDAIKNFGRVDGLVHCAGILRDAIFHKMSVKDWHDVMDVHLHGAFYLSKALAAPFREQKSGSILYMTSTGGLIGSIGQANYSAAKVALVGLARSIAIDMQRSNVRANCLAPFAWSRMMESIPVETEEQKANVEKLKTLKPETIAPLAVFLMSDSSADVSGQIFAVRRNEIFLFSQPRPIRGLHRADGWTPDLVATQLKDSFKKILVPVERTPEVFPWDPI